MAHGCQWKLVVHPHNGYTKSMDIVTGFVSVRIFGAGDSTDNNNDDNPTSYYKAVLRTKTMTKSTRAFNNEIK
jgi:hypothetical protein